MNNLINIDGNLYLPSENVKVFPTAYRGAVENINGDVIQHINIESKLSTENSLRHLSPAFTKNSYVLDWEGSITDITDPTITKKITGTISCFINGYYFELKFGSDPGYEIGNNLFLCIKTAETELVNSETTTRLVSWHETTNSNDSSSLQDDVLDYKYDSTNNLYAFTGLTFKSTRPSENNVYYLDLTKSKDSLKLPIKYTAIESSAEGISITGLLYNGTGVNAIRGGNESTTAASGDYAIAVGNNAAASGNYAVAEGLGVKASATNQHVFGKYNVEDNTNTDNTSVEIVGWGSGTSGATDEYKNIRTLDRLGNEEIKGKLTAAGADLNGTTNIIGTTNINTDTASTSVYNTTIGRVNGTGNSNKVNILGNAVNIKSPGIQMNNTPGDGSTLIGNKTTNNNINLLGDKIYLDGANVSVLGSTDINTSSTTYATRIGNKGQSAVIRGSVISINTESAHDQVAADGSTTIGNSDSALTLNGSSITTNGAITANNLITGTITKAQEDESGNNIKDTYAHSLIANNATLTLRNNNNDSQLSQVTINNVQHASEADVSNSLKVGSTNYSVIITDTVPSTTYEADTIYFIY